jgi:hypothetical protein
LEVEWSKLEKMHARPYALLVIAPIFTSAFVLTPNSQSKGVLKDFTGIHGFNPASICHNSKESRRSPTRTSMSSSSDLLIVGAGYLGGMLVSEYKSIFPTARVIAETRSVLQRPAASDFPQNNTTFEKDHLQARTAEAKGRGAADA